MVASIYLRSSHTTTLGLSYIISLRQLWPRPVAAYVARPVAYGYNLICFKLRALAVAKGLISCSVMLSLNAQVKRVR